MFSSVKPVLEGDESTRTEWTGTTIQWSADDHIRMAYTVAGVWQGASDSSTSPKLYASNHLAEATDVAEFTVNASFTSTATGTHVFYGLYPGTLSASDFSNAPIAAITIPIEQNPAADSFDGKADVMIGVSEELTEKPSSEETVLMSWTRLVAHADLTIKNLTINDGETIESITLTAQEGADLVGMHNLNIVTGEFSNAQGTTNEIVLKADNLTYANKSVKVWASMLPATITALTVTVETDKAYYARSFTGISREFKKNRHNTMNIGMSSAVRTDKPQNLSDYEENFYSSKGDFSIRNDNLGTGLSYVWTHDNNNHYEKASAYVSSSCHEAISYLISPELTIGSNLSKLTFDHAANKFNGATVTDYLSVVAIEGENETPLVLDVVPTGSDWNFVTSTISLSSFYGKTIQIGFKYTSTTSVAGTWEVKNFKVTDIKIKQAAGLSFGETTSYEVEIGDDFTPPTLTNPHNVPVVYSSNNEDVAVVDENTGEILLGDEAGTATITASFEGNDDYLAGSASYTITLVDPNAVDYVTLDWNYEGGTKDDLENVIGVTTFGLGTDYAESNAPYRVKFDGDGDYIQVKTDVAISTVSVGYKMIGGNTTSHLYIYESADGTTWNEKIDDLIISGAQNSTGTVTTVTDFNSSSRYVKIEFKKGANVGIGAISIHKVNTDPVIVASNVTDFAAAGGNSTLTYTVKNFTDDVEVGETTGCVTSASVSSSGTVSFTVAPNYTTSAASGTIVLQSAADNAISKTVNVSQLSSSLSVSATEITIPAAANTATFTVTSAELGYNAVVATTETGMNLSVSGGASGSASASAQTVTISSTTVAPTSGDAITLGTISVYRNNNSSDPQIKTITIKKAVAGVSTYILNPVATGGNSSPHNAYGSAATITIDNIEWSVTGNSSMVPWRIGGKSLSEVDREIYSSTAINMNVSKIEITHGAASSITVNSMTVIVSKNADFSSPVSTLTPTFAANDKVTVSRPAGADWSNCYYKFVYNVTVSGTSNKFLEFSKAEFTGAN